MGSGGLDANLQRLGKAERYPPRGLLAKAKLAGVRSLVGDDDKLRIAAGKTNFDPTRLELAADLQNSFAEEVEKPEMERGTKSLAQTSRRFSCRFIAEPRSDGEVFLDRLDVTVELHRDITMTSFKCLVKGNIDIDVTIAP